MPDGTVLVEAAAITEYLDEVYRNQRKIPPANFHRSYERPAPKSKTKMPEAWPGARSSTSGWRSASTVS